MSQSDSAEQIQEVLRLQNEILRQQQELSRQLLSMKKELIESQESNRTQGRKLFRASIIIFVVYLIYSVAPLFFI